MGAQERQHKKQPDFLKKSFKGAHSMKNPSEYLKMRVLAAIDMAEGKTITARIRAVSEMTFEDEQGQRHRFTFRTIDEVR